jgi:hypothetical protein
MSLHATPILLRLVPALVVAVVAYGVGGPGLALHVLGWYGAFLLNFRLIAGMASGTAGTPAMALAWGTKLPATLGLAALFLVYSSPLAMVLGLVGAVHALLGSAVLAPPLAPPRPVQEP